MRALADGATLPASSTREVVDLDQLFNTLNPKTRIGLQRVIQGFAEQYAGASRAVVARPAMAVLPLAL